MGHSCPGQGVSAPQWVCGYFPLMGKTKLREVVAHNLTRLMGSMKARRLAALIEERAKLLPEDERVTVDHTTIDRIKKGKHSAKLDTLQAIADVLTADPLQLFEPIPERNADHPPTILPGTGHTSETYIGPKVQKSRIRNS